MSSRKTPLQSWFRDPTFDEAARNLMRNERGIKDKRAGKPPEPPRVYIASPYKGDTESNVRNALRYCRFAVKQGYFPLAPHCYLPLFMDDGNPAERKLALSFGLRLLYGCREVWVFGDRISEGMRSEINAAKRNHIRVRQFTENCKEVFCNV
jgi:hypothetical protein